LKAPLYALEHGVTQLHYFTTVDYGSEGSGDYLPGISSKTKENAMDLMKPSTKARLILKHFNLSKMKVDPEKTKKMERTIRIRINWYGISAKIQTRK